ncbi:Nucleic acid-binding, OB-fold-like protein [Thalictrum thalictroides]|uniref:Nucleic acid-binding, OB-fold-like protein n=1 Tax=Thalictrum thalictroides TaxID=46969 RepID=A0A7J6UY09_THATH|nr:Nucleic acid-binding, OB-fold-like protein [Thalictrum thalictroides]
MKGGRKNLKRASEEETFTLQEGQCIMQVVSLRGSNLIEVMDAGGKKSLAIFPAKFQKSMWIKRGNFVVVDERGRDMALESGSKVACTVLQVLVYGQVRTLQKSPEWPEIFKSTTSDNAHPQKLVPETAEELNSSDDDDLPPLQANLNRIRPAELSSEPDSDSDSEPSEQNTPYVWSKTV